MVGEIGAGQAAPAGAVARHRGQDHDRRPGAGGRRRGRALRVDRPRRRPGARSTRRPRRRPAHPARRRGRRAPATCWSRTAPSSGRATSACSPRSAAATVRVAAATAGRGDLHRLRAARARHPARPRLDLRRQLLPARRRRAARPARSPTGSASSPTSRAPSSTRCSDQLVRADLVVTTGGVSPGRLRRRQGGAVAARHRVVRRRSRCSPGKPQGFGTVGEDDTPIFTLPGNPVSSYVSFEMFVLPAIRKMMGQHAVRPADRARPGSPTAISSPRRAPAARARRRTTSTPAAVVTPVGGHGSHLIGDLAIVQRADRGPRGRHVGRGRRPGRRCCGSTRSSDGRAAGPAHPRRRVGRRADGRRVRQGRHRPHRRRLRPGAGVAARGRRCCAARACPRATRSRSPGSPGSWAPSRRPR